MATGALQVSADSGRGVSVPGSQLSQHGTMVYEFEIPQNVVGLFIGRQGRTVGWIERKSSATIMVRKHPFRRDYQICSIEGRRHALAAPSSPRNPPLPTVGG